MGEKRYRKHYVRRPRKSLVEDEHDVEDRLSSLPDAILIDILSRLEIDDAAATSVLSSRWRHLWTDVTHFKFGDLVSILLGEYTRLTSFSAVMLNILRQLTSNKLSVFTVDFAVLSSCAPDVVESCFHELSCRNVEQIIISSVPGVAPADVFHAPACVFEIQSLVVLELEINCLVHLPDNPASIHFPNMKKLCLGTLVCFPSWLGILFNSCPLLEHLNLSFDLFKFHSEPHSDLQISASSLTALHIKMLCPTQIPRPKIFIDAPALTRLSIDDSTSCYYFVQKPSRLIEAQIVSKMCECHVEDVELVGVEEEYLHQMSKFIAGMSSVSELELELSLVYQSQNHIYTYINYLNHQPLTAVFLNLVSLQTTLDGVGFNGWRDLLLSLQCFPNLNHLTVDMGCFYPSQENSNRCVPDRVPDCLVSKLREVKISVNLNMVHGEQTKLLAYILRNARVLRKFHFSIGINGNSSEARLWIATMVCRLLLKLPRGSSTCEIVVSNSCESLIVSSNNFSE